MEKKLQEGQTDRSGFPVTVTGFKWMIAGVVLVIVGFVLMSGGGSDDPNVFSEDIFSFRRITLAPIVVITGFALVGVGIMCRPLKKKD